MDRVVAALPFKSVIRWEYNFRRVFPARSAAEAVTVGVFRLTKGFTSSPRRGIKKRRKPGERLGIVRLLWSVITSYKF